MSVKKSHLDLTILVPEFPENPHVEISRDALVSRIARSFGPDCQKQVVISDDHYGKTNLLSQFCRRYPSNAISYFITSNPLTHNYRNFLYVICNQITKVLEGKSLPPEISEEDLRNIYTGLSVKLSEYAKIYNQKFYIVVDGIEIVLESEMGRVIVNNPPILFPSSPYLLLSCSLGTFEKLPDQLKKGARREFEAALQFNLNDTEKYLSDLELTTQDIKHINEKSKGVAGYLAVLHDSIKLSGRDWINAGELPDDLRKLINNRVEHVFNDVTPLVRESIEVIALAPKPISICYLQDYFDESIPLELLINTGLIISDENRDKVFCKQDLAKKSIQEKVGKRKTEIKQKLLKIVQRSSKQDDKLLTLLLEELNDYSGLVALLDTNTVKKSLEAGDIKTVIERMRKTSKLALGTNKIEETAKWSWGLAAIKEFLSHAATTHEVTALIAIGESQKALKMAYNFPEAISKIKLLAKVYTSMKDRNEHVPMSALDELEVMINEQEIDKLEKEVVKDIAIDILPLLPDKAVALLEKVIGEPREQNLIDVALATVETTTEDTNIDFNENEIDNRPLEYFARMQSSWLQKLYLANLIKEIEDLESTKAKEFMIRQWCLQNTEHDELSYGIELWLDTVIHDEDFVISLRSLRQLSELLQYLSLVDRRRLFERFKISVIESLRTPWEEWVGFHLNLAEAMSEYEPSNAEDKVNDVYEIINIEIEDHDIKVFCYARLWGSFRRMGLGKKDEDVKNNLERVLSHLLKHAALHDEILNKTLCILAGIDINYALDVAFRLNTLERRHLAIKTVLINGFRKQPLVDLSVIFRQVINEFEPPEQDKLLFDITEDLSKRQIYISDESQKLLYFKSREIKSYINKSIALVNLATVWTHEKLVGVSKILDEAHVSWQNEGDLKKKIIIGFQLVERIAQIDISFAQQFCEDVQSILIFPGAELAVGRLGVMYVASIDLAIRSLSAYDINEQENLDRIFDQIDRLPATLLRHHLCAQLAAKIYSVGNYPVADEIVQDKILHKLQDVENQYIRDNIIRFSLPVIFSYSQDMAKELARELSASNRNRSWFSVILWSIVKGQLGDITNFDSHKVATNSATIRDKAFVALTQIKEDAGIYLGIKVITRSIEYSVRQQKLDGKNAFDILFEIEEYAKQKLPDKQNIKHAGYKIISLARINGARSQIYREIKRKGHFNKVDIRDRWRELERLTKEEIDNRADRVYVTTNLAKEMFVWDANKAEILLDCISDEIKDIPSILDRSNRLDYIAKTWGMWGKVKQANFFYSQSIDLINELDSFSQDKKLEHIVQAAYEISPDFADEIVERLDSRFPEKVLEPFRFSLRSLKYSDNLGGLIEDSKSNQNQIQGLLIKTSVKRMLNELVIQNGYLPPSEIILDMIYRSSFYEPHVVVDVLKWALECEYRQQRSYKAGLFNMFIQSSDFIHGLAKWISPSAQRGISQDVFDMLPGLSLKVVVFQTGQRKRAVRWVKNWITQNAEEYIKVCDPYFGPQELAFLSDMPRDIKILIITTSEKFANKDDPEKIRQELQHAWRNVGKGKIPSMTLLIVPAKLEKTFHDRAIVTKNSGLNVGPSLNGLGNEMQRITELEYNEARELEIKYIDDMLNQSKWFVNHSVHPEYIII